MSEWISDYPAGQLHVFDPSEGMVPATDAEIAAAHPKCETCGHFDRARSPDGFPLEWGYCSGGLATDGYQMYKEDPAGLLPSTTDYCPHHTALTGAPDETE